MSKIAMSAVIVILSLAATSYANPVIWGVNASSCTPDNTAIQGNLYLNSAGSTGFATGKTGDVVMYCAVPELDSAPGNIEIGYIDDTASSTNHVKAQLIAMNYATGSISTLATIDSQNFASSATYVLHTLSADFTGFDAATDAYYIRIDLVRTAAQHETMFVVGLLGP